MGKYRTEKDLKSDIFKAYSEYHNETSSDRRQKHFERFYDITLRWFTDYLFNKEEFSSVVLWRSLSGVVKKERKERNEFFPYLKKTLNNVRNEYLRDEGWIPREKKKDFRDIQKYLEKEERDLERKLSSLEKVQRISLLRQISESDAWKLMDEIEMGEITSLDEKINDDTGTMHDVVPSKSLDPQEEFVRKSENQKLCDAVEAALNSKPEGTIKFYRAIFTLYCIKKRKVFNFNGLSQVLDSDTLNLYRKSKKTPTQKEIYMKLYPNPVDSANETATNLLKDFLAELSARLIEPILKIV